MNLFIDTETTGKANFKLPPDHESQPRIIQLAAAIADDTGVERGHFSFLIKPDGWVIPEEASAIHGYTTEMCTEAGVPIIYALDTLERLATRCRKVVAHNFDFDNRMVIGESSRCYRLVPINGLVATCTMKLATPILKIPGRYDDFKWPSLAETHRHFFKTDIDGAHDAMADVRACMRCFYAINAMSN
jgi:DNA polymerase-3 subunit epsilon